jgi:hypothetical protein
VTKADEYRQLASECLRSAELVTDAEAKLSMRAMAREWLQLAASADAPLQPEPPMGKEHKE